MWAQFVGADVRVRSPQEMSVFVLPELGVASVIAILLIVWKTLGIEIVKIY